MVSSTRNDNFVDDEALLAERRFAERRLSVADNFPPPAQH